jgi:AcrR family transcriptional regulator
VSASAPLPTGEPDRAGLEPRNATEDAILATAREVLEETSYKALTIDGLARRAFVSRTSVYFYFPNKRAIVDRLIQQAFAEMYVAVQPYVDGDGNPRAELRLAIGRLGAVVNRNAPVLRIASHLSGSDDRMPSEWQPYLSRFVEGAARRIARDQERGIAPRDIPAATSAQALTAMVERMLTLEVIRGDGDAAGSVRVLAELWWRAVYAQVGRA